VTRRHLKACWWQTSCMVTQPQAARDAGRRRIARLTGLTMAGSLALGGGFTVAAQAAYSGKSAAVPAPEVPLDDAELTAETDPSTAAPSLGATTSVEAATTTTTAPPLTTTLAPKVAASAPVVAPEPTTVAPEPETTAEPEQVTEPPTTQAPRPRVTAAPAPRPAPRPRPAPPARPATGSGGS
jgi:outer membrane biosynthesis protein TonB